VADDRPTEEQPPADGEPRPGAETERFDRPPTDNTSVMPPAVGPEQAPARWAARAGVPVGGPRQTAPEQQWVPDQPPRTWWAPILIGLAILLLVGLIALGLWVATRSRTGTGPSPSTTPSSAATSASPSPTPSVSTSPTPTVTMVTVPSLRGVALTDAEQILQSQGLDWKVVTRVSDAFPAGTVIETDPAANSRVPAGTDVTLFVATPPPSSPAPSSASPSAR